MASGDIATAKVLQTYELVEHILTYINEPYDLRGMCLVNSLWKTIIAGTAILQARWQRRRSTVFGLALAGTAIAATRPLASAWAHGHRVKPPKRTRWLYSYFNYTFCVDGEQWQVDFSVLDYTYGPRPELIQDSTFARAHAYVLVYSVCSRESFKCVMKWQKSIEAFDEPMHEQIEREFKGLWGKLAPKPKREHFCLGVVATPAGYIEVPDNEGRDLARRLGCSFYRVEGFRKEDAEESMTAMIRDYRTGLDERRLKQLEEIWRIRKAALEPCEEAVAGSAKRKHRWQRWFGGREGLTEAPCKAAHKVPTQGQGSA